ncbi:hypothetical protein F4819DRAFT_490046 [Hypoxylon fuscum]|nr:hypothetical protein F4819DRAFT_490046 [Hypoxylon fuscum]
MRRVIAQSSTLPSPKVFPLSKFPVSLNRPASSQTQPPPQHEPTGQRSETSKKDEKAPAKQEKKKKSVAELDAELQLKMSGLSGDGGEAGVEYEDGEPVAMKRSVKNNMFRYI